MDERSAWAEKVRRWGWVSVALGLPGASQAVLYASALAGDGGRPNGFVVALLALLTAPTLLGARMIWVGHRVERPDPAHESPERRPGPRRSHRSDRRFPSPRSTVASALLGLCVFAVLAATAIPGCGCSTRQKAYTAAMKSDLRNLASQQEIFFADHDRYTHDPAALGFVTSQGVDVTVFVSPHGWVAFATHEALGTGVGCAISYGEAGRSVSTPGGIVPAGPGEIVCDEA